MMKDLKEKIKIEAKAWQSHVETRFLGERSSPEVFSLKDFSILASAVAPLNETHVRK